MTTPLHPRLVATIRWDYEIGLLSRADVVRKYRLVVSQASAYQTMAGTIYPDVKPMRHRLAWAKLSWRKIK